MQEVPLLQQDQVTFAASPPPPFSFVRVLISSAKVCSARLASVLQLYKIVSVHLSSPKEKINIATKVTNCIFKCFVLFCQYLIIILLLLIRYYGETKNIIDWSKFVLFNPNQWSHDIGNTAICCLVLWHCSLLLHLHLQSSQRSAAAARGLPWKIWPASAALPPEAEPQPVQQHPLHAGDACTQAAFSEVLMGICGIFHIRKYSTALLDGHFYCIGFLMS